MELKCILWPELLPAWLGVQVAGPEREGGLLKVTQHLAWDSLQLQV